MIHILAIAFSLLITALIPSVYAQASAPTFTWSHSTINLPLDQLTTQTVTLRLDTQGQAVFGSDVVVRYNPAVLSVTGVTFGSPSLFPSTMNRSSQANGVINVSGSFSQVADSYTGTGNFISFQVRGVSVGQTTLQFECSAGSSADTNIIAPYTGQDVVDCGTLPNVPVSVVVPPTPTPTLAPTPTPVVTPAPTPTPTPTAPPQACLTIQRDLADPTVGQAVRFTCGLIPNVTRYEFRYRVLGTNFEGAINPITVSANVSEPLTILHSGTYGVECRGCIDASCSAYTGW